MQPLPVPSLDQTLTTYLTAVRPLVSDEQFAVTTRLVTQFQETDGALLQEQLLAKAERTAAAGSNWFAQDWEDLYLSERAPLPLSTNVAFELMVPGEGEGTARAAAVLYRLASAHLAHLRGDMPPEIDGRGTAMSPLQLDVLAGGLRRPGVPIDTVDEGNMDPASRSVLLLRGAVAFLVPVSDENGLPLPPATLKRFLDEAMAAGAPLPLTDSTDGKTEGGQPPYGGWSYLGARRALGYENAIRAREAGARDLDRIADALFVVGLEDTERTRDEHLYHLAFLPGRAYPDKPLSYRIGLADPFVGVHIQHSHVDGGTMAWVIGQAQQVQVPGGDTDPTGQLGDAGSAPALQRLNNPLSADLSGRLVKDLYEYARVVGELKLTSTVVPPVDTSSAGVKVSADFLGQLVIAYAQQQAYGSIGNTYEAVDMRGYQAGRTEAVRPVTVEMKDFVTALHAGTASVDELVDGLKHAAEQHRQWIKRCKSGNGINRHLLALRILGRQAGTEMPLFEDESYVRLTTDVVSTSSLGSHAQVGRVVFAPTSQGGLGVNYTVLPEGMDFAVTGTCAERDPDAFVAGLQQAGHKLTELFETLESRSR